MTKFVFKYWADTWIGMIFCLVVFVVGFFIAESWLAFFALLFAYYTVAVLWIGHFKNWDQE